MNIGGGKVLEVGIEQLTCAHLLTAFSERKETRRQHTEALSTRPALKANERESCEEIY
jgi:hypothetical protein